MDCAYKNIAAWEESEDEYSDSEINDIFEQDQKQDFYLPGAQPRIQQRDDSRSYSDVEEMQEEVKNEEFSQPEQRMRCVIPKRKRRRAAVNVARVDIMTILQDTALSTGDPIICNNCGAFFNKHSLLTIEEQQQIWECEFCDTRNFIDVDEEEIPQDQRIKYVLDGAVQAALNNQGENNDRTLIFCIDISGSMCVTTPVEGNIQLKTNQNTKEQQLMREFRDDGEQFLPQENRNLTYISRLECVQAAIDNQINELQTATPNRKVGIVTFNNEVTIIGDGSANVVISGDKLNSWEQIENQLQGQYANLLGQNIGQSKDMLKKRVMELQEGGPTALGPALLASILMAKQSSSTAEVIICTDGIANVGLGSYEEDEEVEQADTFYNQLTTLAQNSNITVSVISISGDDCKLHYLSNLVDSTEGDLNKIDPTQLHQNFANILANQVIATQVRIEVNLHKQLQIQGNHENMNESGSKMVKILGTVTQQTDFLFEYSLREKTEKTHLPCQVIIYHTKLDGMKCALVDSLLMETAFNQQADDEINYDIIASNYRQNIVKNAKEGNIRKAQEQALHFNRKVLSKNADDSRYQAMQQELFEVGEDLNEEAKRMKDVDAKERGKFQLFTDKAVVMMNKFKKRFSQ